MSRSSLAALGAVALAASAVTQVSPPLPSLPTQFEAWVHCNIINKNYSVVVHEVYDAPSNRAMLSMYHPFPNSTNFIPPPPPRPGSNRTRFQDQGMSRTLYDYSQDTFYHTNSSGCYGGNISATRSFLGNPVQGRIPSVSQWFDFGDQVGEQYMGRTLFNGAPVDWWRSDQSNATANTTMVLDYYFTTTDWHSWNGNGTQLPVALNLTGSRPNYVPVFFPNGSMSVRVDGVYTYYHVYVFNGFHVGAPRHGHSFMLPAGTACVSLDGTSMAAAPVAPASGGGSDGSTGVSTGGVVATFFAALVIGVLGGFVVARRGARSAGSAASAAPTFSNVLATEPGPGDQTEA